MKKIILAISLIILMPLTAMASANSALTCDAISGNWSGTLVKFSSFQLTVQQPDNILAGDAEYQSTSYGDDGDPFLRGTCAVNNNIVTGTLKDKNKWMPSYSSSITLTLIDATHSKVAGKVNGFHVSGILTKKISA